VSSIPDANTLFEAEDKRTDKRHRDKRDTEERHRREIEGRSPKEITEQITEEEPGPLRHMTSEGPSTLKTQIVVTTSEFVNKKYTYKNGYFSRRHNKMIHN
jgi:hypothetical protein